MCVGVLYLNCQLGAQEYDQHTDECSILKQQQKRCQTALSAEIGQNTESTAKVKDTPTNTYPHTLHTPTTPTLQRIHLLAAFGAVTPNPWLVFARITLYQSDPQQNNRRGGKGKGFKRERRGRGTGRGEEGGGSWLTWDNHQQQYKGYDGADGPDERADQIPQLQPQIHYQCGHTEGV